MDRRLLGTQRVPSAMEIELPRQNSSSDLPQPVQPNPRFADLQLRRENRRTSENKFADIRNPQPQQKLCDFCSQLILLSIYDQHIMECPQKPENQQKNNDALMVEDLEVPQNQEDQSQTNTMETEENQLQLSRPLQDAPINPSEQAPENFFNLFGRFRNPNRTFPRPEPQQPQAPSPSSFLSNIFNSIFSPSRQQERPNNLPIEAESQTDPTNSPTEGQAQQTQPDDEGGIFPRGAIFVRTIQPGPNGSIIVRMRVIPLGSLFNPQEENREGNEPSDGGLVGSLLSMLIGLHGHGGELFNLFHEERGLEKEALDSLPVVPYNTEAFKNVDEELKSCPICLDHFEEEQEIRFLWCLHRFHKNCVDQWLDKHTNCPICKKDYSEAVKNCQETSQESCEGTCQESS